MASSSILRLADEPTAQDLRTFVGRAAAVERDGAVRLQATGQVLAATVAVLPGHGLTAQGLTLGLRAMALAEPVEPALDVVVPLAGLLDRFAREESTELPVPPTEVRVAWAGQAAPRAGWEPLGSVDASMLSSSATAGIAEVAGSADQSTRAVDELRRQVWGRPVLGAPPGVTAGMAFAAHVLGFLAPGTVTAYRNGPWARLTAPGGHVLAR